MAGRVYRHFIYFFASHHCGAPVVVSVNTTSAPSAPSAEILHWPFGGGILPLTPTPAAAVAAQRRAEPAQRRVSEASWSS